MSSIMLRTLWILDIKGINYVHIVERNDKTGSYTGMVQLDWGQQKKNRKNHRKLCLEPERIKPLDCFINCVLSLVFENGSAATFSYPNEA